jgi:hypothetical protein
MAACVRRWSWIFVVMMAACVAAPAWGQAAGDDGAGPMARPTSWTDDYPWLKDFVVTILAVGLLCLLIYLFRPGGAGGWSADFTIEVDGADVTFKGRFPAGQEGLVEDFLVNDCKIEGAYRVTGKWDESRLVVNVSGENATPLEQRIRNFLKLNVKKGS